MTRCVAEKTLQSLNRPPQLGTCRFSACCPLHCGRVRGRCRSCFLNLELQRFIASAFRLELCRQGRCCGVLTSDLGNEFIVTALKLVATGTSGLFSFPKFIDCALDSLGSNRGFCQLGTNFPHALAFSVQLLAHVLLALGRRFELA